MITHVMKSRIARFLLALLLICNMLPLTPDAEAQQGIPPMPALRFPWLYGSNRISGGATYGCDQHIGEDYYAIDFDLDSGTRLAAAFSGRVYRGTLGGLGNYIWIDHGDGWTALYGHVGSSTDDGLRVKPGTEVQQGAFIGVSGNTGLNSTGDHLHFRVRYTPPQSGNVGPLTGTGVEITEMGGETIDFGQYGLIGSKCTNQGDSPWWSAPASGGWWLGPTPSDLSILSTNNLIPVNVHAVDNNNNGLKAINVTMYNPITLSWAVQTMSLNGQSQYDLYTEYAWPSGANYVLVSFNVYSRNGGFQLAPQGIRKYCRIPMAVCEHTASDAMAYDGGHGGGAGHPHNSTFNCPTPLPDEVALYVEPNYGGSCVFKGIGDYVSSDAIGLSNDAIASVKVGANVKVVLCDNAGLNSPCEWFEDDDPDLANNSIGVNTVSSVRVERRPQTTNCSPGADEVALFDGTNYTGICTVLGLGSYSDPSAMHITNDTVSSLKTGSNAKVQICRDAGHSNTCEYFQGDDSDLGNNSIGSDQASSAKVEIRGFIELCDGTNFGGPCQTFSEGSYNLPQEWQNRVESVRYLDAYRHHYHLVLWTGLNQTGNPYHADDHVADLGIAHHNQIKSVQIYHHQPPGPPSNPAPADGMVLSASTTSVNLTYNGADQSRVHVWRDGYDFWRDWSATHSVQLTGLTPGIYYWQAQSRNVEGPGSWSPVWTFYVNRAPEVGAVADVEMMSADSYSFVVSALDLDGTTPSLSVSGQPSFVVFNDHGNGTATITLTPDSGNVGNYTGITVTANDGSLTGSDTFDLTVIGSIVPTPTATASPQLTPTFTSTPTLTPSPTPVPTNTPSPTPQLLDLSVHRNNTVVLAADGNWNRVPDMVLSGTFPAGATLVSFSVTMNNAAPSSTVYAAISVDGVQQAMATWLTDTTAGETKTVPMLAIISLPAGAHTIEAIVWTNSGNVTAGERILRVSQPATLVANKVRPGYTLPGDAVWHQLDGMSLTFTGSGTYNIQFATSVSNSQRHSTLFMELHVDGVSQGLWTFVTDGGLASWKYDLPWFAKTVTLPDGNHSVTVKAWTNSGSLSISERTLVVTK